MPASTQVGNEILDCYLRGVVIVQPTLVYCSLHTADPGNTGLNEVSIVDWPAYVRKDPAVGTGIANGFGAAAGKITTNLLDILFAAHNGLANVTVSHVGIWRHPSSGLAANFMFKGTIVDILSGLPTTRTYSPSDEPIIHPGELDFSVT